jgi:hypothetical protein
MPGRGGAPTGGGAGQGSKPQAAEGRPTEMAAQGFLNERGGRSTTRALHPCSRREQTRSVLAELSVKTRPNVSARRVTRVFPPVAPQQGAQGETHQHAQDSGAHDNALQANMLEVEVKLLREMLDTMREDRDVWREMAGKVTAALPAPCAPLQAPRPSWWRRLAG